MPGFIDPHTHLGISGAYLSVNYVGPIESPGPNGMNAALLDLVYANRKMIERLGVTDATNVHGIGKCPDGRLNGQFAEMEALHVAFGPVSH